MTGIYKKSIGLIVLLGIALWGRQIQDHRDTLLLEACDRGDVRAVRHTLEKGANPNARCYFFLANLQYWSDRPQGGSMPEDYNPILVAAKNGNVDMVKLLLDHGANPNTVGVYDHEGGTYEKAFSPLRWVRGSAGSQYVEIEKLLVAAGAKE